MSDGPRSAALGRVPPHNLRAEESVLGAMLLSREAIADVVEILEPEHFYKPAHGHLFDAVMALYSGGEPVDAVTVADELKRAGLLEEIGGPAVLLDFQATTPAISNASHYAKIVEEHALLRRMIFVSNEIAEIAYGVPEDVVKAVDDAEARMFDVAQRRVTNTTAPIRDLLPANLDRIEMLYDRGEAITGLSTGYLDLDEKLAGLQPEALYVVGARPAMGKTAFSLGMAANSAMKDNRPVLIFTLEMGQLELSQRLLCSEALVDAGRVKTGRLEEAEWNRISHAVGRLAEAPIYIDDSPHTSVMDIRAKARRLKSREGDLGMVVVDYIQLMSGRTSAESRQVEVSEISRNLKILARELGAPVIALAQLNRGLEQRTDKRPMLSDLRESGCLPAETQIMRADGGREVTIGELAESGEQPVVWSVDDGQRLVARRMTRVFPTGVRPVYDLRLASGCSVTATANHPFLTVDGWVRLDEVRVGGFVATPRAIPEPVRSDSGRVQGSEDLTWFLEHVGRRRDRGHVAGAPRRTLNALTPDPDNDLVPSPVSGKAVTGKVDATMTSAGVSHRQTAVALGPDYCGSAMLGSAPRPRRFSRHRSRPGGQTTGSAELVDIATSDLYWDEVISIEPAGTVPTFDATVPGTHNFIADGIVVHNSLEQDADVVLFLYRDEVYDEQSPDKGVAEVIIAKHRNGPTGKVRLAFRGQYTRFDNMAPSSPAGGGGTDF